MVAVAQREFEQHFPEPGWVEHDAEEIWASQEATLREVLGELEAAGRQPLAMGITNQRETTIVWDRQSGEPVHRAIVWQDRRTADFCQELKNRGLEERFSEKTGLRLDPYFSGTKVRWILENVPGARERAERGELCFGTVDAWLIWKLTNGRVHATDITNASRTLLLNIHTGEWDEELCELLEVPLALLPEVKSCSEVYGQSEDGLAISGVAGDQHAALFGQACFEAGMAKNTYGTGCFLLMNTGEQAVKSENDLLTTVAWEVNGRREYALEGSVFIGGAVVQWLRDGLGLIDSAAEVNEVAATVEDNGGMYFVPAFTGLGAPHWDPFARGLAVGITRGTTKGHFCRAALESIAFQSAELVECMVADSGLPLQELRVDGGATGSELLMQFQSSLLEEEVVCPRVMETTALGAAYLAGLAVGMWESQEEIAKQWAVAKRFKPAQDFGSEGRMKEWKKAVERSKGWAQ